MPLPRLPLRMLPITLVTALLLATGVAGCGGAEHKPAAKARAKHAATQCRSHWRELGQSVLGLDQDPEPSSLASRWTSIVATIQYYETSATPKNCHATIEAEIKSIAELRQLSDKLRPYDMSYQLQRVQPSIDLYLHDPLPAPTRNDNHKLVKPPAKAAVQQAMQTLSTDASAADVELQPAWAQLASVDLDDVTALRNAVLDLDRLAQQSAAWRRCEEALQVLVAAVRAQEGASAGGG